MHIAAFLYEMLRLLLPVGAEIELVPAAYQQILLAGVLAVLLVLLVNE